MTNEEKILDAKIGEEIFLDHHYLKKVEFDYHPSMPEHPYSWVAYSVSNNWMAIFPMRDSNYVVFFKTLIGAKRNFIRQYLKNE